MQEACQRWEGSGVDRGAPGASAAGQGARALPGKTRRPILRKTVVAAKTVEGTVNVVEYEVAENARDVDRPRSEIAALEARMERRFAGVDRRLLAMDKKIDALREKISDLRFDAMQQRQARYSHWMVGLLVTGVLLIVAFTAAVVAVL